MLQQSLKFTQVILDQYLRLKFGLSNECVALNSVIKMDGTLSIENQNKMIISLLNLEQETNKQFYGRTQRLADGSFASVQPTERYNLDVLFTANFTDYNETLKFLNGTLAFFQVNRSINKGSFASIPKGIDRIDYDIEQITYHQMHSLWSAMGAKYQPSVIYKLRLIQIQSDEAVEMLPSVNDYESSLAQ